MKTYTVQRGDSLFKITQKFYGDGYKYTQLAAFNGLANPNALEIGQVLDIPEPDELEHPLRAWHHYHQGTIYWRVTEKGVEIKGQGLVMEPTFTVQAEKIWKTFRNPILAASKKYGVPAPVIIATISTESSGESTAYRYEPAFYKRYIQDKTAWKDNPYYDDPKRISASYGLMQIMYPTAYTVGFRGEPEDLYDPQQNIEAGAAYIASKAQVKQHGWDPPKIACAYNAGSVRPTMTNAWGMFFHPGHLDRWIPSYNGAIQILGAQEAPDVITPPVTEIEPPAPQPPKPSLPETEDVVTVQFLFPASLGKTWQPLIVDLFQHDETGIGEPFSFTIDRVKKTQHGYTAQRTHIKKGVYDLVLTDAATSSVIHDIAEYEITTQPTTIDLRQAFAPQTTPPQTSPSEKATLRIRFPQAPGQTWNPLIIDVFKHQPGGLGDPSSHQVKIPEYGPDGEYIYDISPLDYGTYDLVFTDAASQSVIHDVANYSVQQVLTTLDVQTGEHRQAASSSPTPPVSRSRGLRLSEKIKAWWNKFWE